MKPADSADHRDGGAMQAQLDAGAVLLVDDEDLVRRGLRRILERAGHRISEASSIATAQRVLDSTAVDVVVIDLGLPDGNGLELLRHESVGRRTAAVVLTGSRDRLAMKKALSEGAMGYLVKSDDSLAIEAQVEAALARLRAQRDQRAARAGIEGSLAELLSRWNSLPKDIALRLCSAWNLRHVETGAHVRRIARYTEALAVTLGVPRTEAVELGEIAMLHDVGKIAIPDAVLSKPGPLNDAELALMKEHTVEGARMLSGIAHPFFERAALVALRHHERWDGTGYPGGLHGESCPLDARIVSVADVYDALGTPRCYKPAWTEQQIVAYFRRSSGALFESRLVEALFDTLPELRQLAEQYPEPADDGARR